jgi:hypothetical protein
MHQKIQGSCSKHPEEEISFSAISSLQWKLPRPKNIYCIEPVQGDDNWHDQSPCVNLIDFTKIAAKEQCSSISKLPSFR